MANYHAGRRKEYAAQRILEAAGYQTIRAASSKGVVDVVAMGECVRLISIKSGSAYASAVERAALEHLKGCGARIEIWRFPARCREPLIEVL